VKRPRDVRARRERLVLICESLPETDALPQGRRNEHLAFRVREKAFAYYLHDHHGDARIALWCKAPPGEQGRLVEEDARRFFVPPYLGPRGWLGVRLDLARVDWNEIAYLVRTAYRLTAPRALLARLEQDDVR
jgi:predicted DNA-binding protein (MmcQ/YjbR family)